MAGLDDPYAVPDPLAEADYPPFPPPQWGYGGDASSGPQLPIAPDIAAAPQPDQSAQPPQAQPGSALEDPNAPGPAPMQPGLGGIPADTIDQVTPQLPLNQLSDDQERHLQVFGDVAQPLHIEPPPPAPPLSQDEESPQFQQLREGREYAQGIDDEANQLAANPEKLAEKDALDAETRDSETRRQKLVLAHQEEDRARQDFLAHRERIAKVQADSDKIVADANAVANTKIDPEGYKHGRSAFQTIADVIGGALGGLVQQTNGGRNIYLDQLNKKIENDIAAQNANIANRWKGIGIRQTANEQDLAREADQYRENETYRQGVYQRAQNEIDLKMQDFDPRSSTVRKLAHVKAQIAAQQQQSLQAFQQQQFKNLETVDKSRQEWAKINETRRHNLATEAPKVGTGVVGPAGAAPGAPKDYPHQLEVYDPFTQQPLFGKRKLSTAEQNEYRTKSTAYAKAQHAMAELDAIGQAGGYDKDTIAEKLGAGGEMRERFEQARAALVQALADGKARGSTGDEDHDKAATGLLGLIDKQIPTAEGWIGQKAGRNPHESLKALQERIDREFTDEFNGLGVQGSQIVDHAKTARKEAPVPSTGQALATDVKGLVDSPSKDMEAATEATRKRIEGEETKKQQGAFAKQLVKVAHPVTDLPETGSADDIARAKVVNAVGKELNDRLAAYNAKPDKDRTDDDAIGTANAMRAYAQAVNDLMTERHERAVKRDMDAINRRETSDQSLIDRGIR